jgi:hypothetical protein
VPLIEPLWVEFAALIGADQRPEFALSHPWGCHRRQIPDRVVFDHVIAALVHGSGYERIATPGYSDRTIPRRLPNGPRTAGSCCAARAGRVRPDDRPAARRLVRGRMYHQGPVRGEVAGPSPADRGKQGMKRSVASDANGLPLHLVTARANDHDSPLLEPTLADLVDMIGTLPQYRDLHGADEFPSMHLDRNPLDPVGRRSRRVRRVRAHDDQGVQGHPDPGLLRLPRG